MMGLPPYSWGTPGTFWYARRYFLVSGHGGRDHRIIFPFDDIIDIGIYKIPEFRGGMIVKNRSLDGNFRNNRSRNLCRLYGITLS